MRNMGQRRRPEQSGHFERFAARSQASGWLLIPNKDYAKWTQKLPAITHRPGRTFTNDYGRLVWMASAALSSPWIFSRLPPKIMIRAQSSLTVTNGDHDVVGAVKRIIPSTSLEVLHLPMRSYGAFQEKIERGREYFAKNSELAPSTGWQWRRWIELFQSGRLREEYEEQFPDEKTVQAFLAEGRLVPETRLAQWWTNEQMRSAVDYL